MYRKVIITALYDKLIQAKYTLLKMKINNRKVCKIQELIENCGLLKLTISYIMDNNLNRLKYRNISPTGCSAISNIHLCLL